MGLRNETGNKINKNPLAKLAWKPNYANKFGLMGIQCV